MDPLNVTICTFNCRSVKSSIMEIKDLCAKSDFVCLQEHWLLPNEVSLLSQLCTDFLAAGSSAVDIYSLADPTVALLLCTGNP